MAFFKLLAGLHECNDPDWVKANPDPPEGKNPPTKMFKVGDVVESDTDLVEQFGHEKFLYLGEVAPVRVPRRPAHHLQPAYLQQQEALEAELGPETVHTPSSVPVSEVASEPEMSEVEYHAALDKMSMSQLRAHAAEEEIQLPPGSISKAEILRILKAK